MKAKATRFPMAVVLRKRSSGIALRQAGRAVVAVPSSSTVLRIHNDIDSDSVLNIWNIRATDAGAVMGVLVEAFACWTGLLCEIQFSFYNADIRTSFQLDFSDPDQYYPHISSDYVTDPDYRERVWVISWRYREGGGTPSQFEQIGEITLPAIGGGVAIGS